MNSLKKLITRKNIVIITALGAAVGILFYLAIAVYVGLHVYDDTKTPSDVVIVLGARAYKQGNVNPCLAARMDHAVDLMKQDYGQYLIVSGGLDREDGVIESNVMRKLAVDAGIDPDAIREESQATSTYENIKLSQEIMKENNWETAVIVTEPFHMPRAQLVASKLSLSATVSPAPDSACWNRWKYASRYFLREPFALVVYWWRGWV